jgi:hypothetical protein
MGAYIDPVVAAAEHYKLLQDGQRARMIEMRLPPGARDNEHSHPNEFVYFIKGSKARIRVDGETMELDIPDGMVMEHRRTPWRTSATARSWPSSSNSRSDRPDRRTKRPSQSARALEADIRACQSRNENPRPFIWTKAAEQILEIPRTRLLQRTTGAGIERMNHV